MLIEIHACMNPTHSWEWQRHSWQSEIVDMNIQCLPSISWSFKYIDECNKRITPSLLTVSFLGHQLLLFILLNVIVVDEKTASIHQYLTKCNDASIVMRIPSSKRYFWFHMTSMVFARVSLSEKAIYTWAAVQASSRINNMLKWMKFVASNESNWNYRQFALSSVCVFCQLFCK